ncbi:MAG: hypothetical protein ACON5D_17475 [Rubripirellula sp.]
MTQGPSLWNRQPTWHLSVRLPKTLISFTHAFQYSVMKIADTRVGYTRVCFSDSLFQCPNDEISDY